VSVGREAIMDDDGDKGWNIQLAYI